MTDLHKAAQQALDRLRLYYYGSGFAEDADCITALEAALAQQAEPKGGGNLPPPLQAEPVAWMCSSPELMAKGYKRFSSRCEGDWNIPVYTAPPQRKPLTEEEIDKIFNHLCNTVGASWKTMARAIERAHGIKERK